MGNDSPRASIKFEVRSQKLEATGRSPITLSSDFYLLTSKLSGVPMRLSRHARFSTVCIHAGQEPDPATGAIITPIFQTSTYVQDALGQHKGYEYARTQNPTRSALEANLAAIEGGRRAFAFASGMAAINAIASRLSSGDHVVMTDNVYGGTYRLFDKVLGRHGITFAMVDTGDLDATRRALTPKTRLLFIETPTNPVMRLTDLAAVSALAHEHDVVVAVDNTFASPCLQRPLELGADLVVHSTTKYLNGHSDSIGGVVVATRDEDIEWLQFVQNAAGAILSPMDSFLVLRGTKTLALRMAQHSANGLALATYLAGTSPGEARALSRACRSIPSTSSHVARCPTASAACSRSRWNRSKRRARRSTASS